jgi:hypothetical protein
MSKHSKNEVPLRAARRRASQVSIPIEPPSFTFQNASELLGDRLYFHPIHAYITGDTRAALLLERIVYWARRMEKKYPKSGGWFYKSELEWFLETGLSKEEQRTARRTLVALGLITIQKRGWPATNHYLLNQDTYLHHLARFLPNATVSGKAHHKTLVKLTVNHTALPQERKSFSVNTEVAAFNWPTPEEADRLNRAYEHLGAHTQMELQHEFFAATDPADNAGVATDDFKQMKWIQILNSYFHKNYQPPSTKPRRTTKENSDA